LQVFTLRIRRVLQAGAPLCITLAGQQQFPEPLRSSERIAFFQKLQHRLGSQLQRAMHVGVLLARHARQFRVRRGHVQP
jgi:hypothetical protein